MTYKMYLVFDEHNVINGVRWIPKNQVNDEDLSIPEGGHIMSWPVSELSTFLRVALSRSGDRMPAISRRYRGAQMVTQSIFEGMKDEDLFIDGLIQLMASSDRLMESVMERLREHGADLGQDFDEIFYRRDVDDVPIEDLLKAFSDEQ